MAVEGDVKFPVNRPSRGLRRHNRTVNEPDRCMNSSLFSPNRSFSPNASMGNSFAVVTGFSMLLGMASALDTFCGQSYGAKQYHMIGIHMQRAMFVLVLVSIPLKVIRAKTGTILTTLGQDPDISEAAQLYARYMIPSIFAYSLLQCLVKFL